jgi:DNA-binding response OmpR family regulator
MYTRTIILVTLDAGLRSAIAARLGMEGITLVTVDSCRDPRVGQYLRRVTLLIVDGTMLHDADRDEWAERLRRRSEASRVVLLTEARGIAEQDGIWTVPRRNAAATILELLKSWRTVPDS